MLKTKCDDLMKRVNALESCHDENDENHCINTTPQKRKTVKEPVSNLLIIEIHNI